MFVIFWIFLSAVSALGTTSSQAWGGRRHKHSPPHNQFGPPHNNFGPPHHGRGPQHRGPDGPPHHQWHDSSESGESDSSSWSGSDDDSGNWHFPCHHDDEDQRWPPKPNPTQGPNPGPFPPPKPTQGPNPGPFPGPKPTQGPNPGPFPSPNPTQRPNPGPFPGPIPTPRPSPGPFPGPNPTQGPNPGPFPGPIPTPRPSPGPFPGPNPTQDPNPGPFPRPNPAPNPGPLPKPTPREPEVQACLRSCPVTSEYNPVCGTDGVTYTNPGRLECARMCGVDVLISRNSRCPANGGGTTSPPGPDVQACIRTCPVTSEYNPVCGSDGVTYSNMGRLECAKMCGVAVTLSRMSRCPAAQPTSSPIPTPSPTGPFKEPETPTPAPTVGPTITPGIDFTIDQGILDEIFPTEGPDLSGLIDERHEDE